MSQLFKIEAIEEVQNIMPEHKPYQNLSNGIEISVWPEFINTKSSNLGEIYIWSYQIRIDNRNKFSIKLISRYWRIIDENGEIQEIKGEGVVGDQPIIASQSSFQYYSGVHLATASGIMSGFYMMKNLENDDNFEVTIPKFSLDAIMAKPILN